MLTFLLVAAIMVCVCFADYRAVLQTGKKRLAALYGVLLFLSAALAGLHCFGFSLYDLLLH